MKSEKKKDDINKRDLSNQKNVDMKQDEENNLPGVKDEASSLSKRNIIWVIVILLGIAIVGTMWFFFFRVINTEPKIDNGSLPTVIIDEPQSQNITKPVEEKVVAPAAKPVQEKKILTKHTLKSGERYFRLSELYYGSTFFWPYIYEANKDRYPNPAIIYKRDYVDIPDLASWGIDVNDPKELEIAKQKCVELVKSGVFEE